MSASTLITGIGLGSMYGLLALGFYVTYAVSRTVNFAQGSAMMLGAVLTFSFAVTWRWPMWAAILASLALCTAWGVAVERVGVRPFVRRGSDAWLMATVAMGIVLENVVLFTFGKDPRGMPPSPLTTEAFYVADIKVQPLQVVIPVAGIAIAVALHWFSYRTRHGRALLAVVQNPDAARLMGINVTAAVVLTFALSGLFAGVAGILIAPLFIISSTMGTLSASRRSRWRSSAASPTPGGSCWRDSSTGSPRPSSPLSSARRTPTSLRSLSSSSPSPRARTGSSAGRR